MTLRGQPDLDAMQRVIAERGSAAFGTWVDGFSYLIAQARAGNLGARAALRGLREGLREMERLLAVTLPGEN